MTALYIAALFASVLLHEIGHALVARQFGIRTVEIVVLPIGGLSRPERQPKAKKSCGLHYQALVNVAIAIILLAWVSLHSGVLILDGFAQPSNADLLQRIALGNCLFGLFNLLPAYPMDGGHVSAGVSLSTGGTEEARADTSGAGGSLAF